MTPAEFDPGRIIAILSGHGVEFVIVGGIGSALHGSPLSTFDIDIVPALEKTNLDRLASALKAMGARMRTTDQGELNLEFDARSLRKWLVDFRFLNLSTAFGPLDLIYRPAGTEGYRDLAPKATVMEIDGAEVKVAGLEDIIRSKQAAGRERDLEHLPTLRRLLERKNRPK